MRRPAQLTTPVTRSISSARKRRPRRRREHSVRDRTTAVHRGTTSVSGGGSGRERRSSNWSNVAAVRWVAAAAVLVALAEAGVIGRLLYLRSQPPPPTNAAVLVEFVRPGADVLVDGQPAGVTPLALTIGPQTRSIRVVSPEAAPAAAAAPAVVAEDPDLTAARPIVVPPAPAAPPAAAPPQRPGALRLSSPIELQVIEGEQVLGSSSQGPVALAAGRHEFDLVNAALGFRSRRVVEINAGQTLTLAVPRPNGDVSINALPWAEVWARWHGARTDSAGKGFGTNRRARDSLSSPELRGRAREGGCAVGSADARQREPPAVTGELG